MLRRKLYLQPFHSSLFVGLSPSTPRCFQSTTSHQHPFDATSHDQDNNNMDMNYDEEFSTNDANNNNEQSANNIHEQMFQASNEQRDEFLRHSRRRRKLQNTTARLLYEFHFLKKLCQKRPTVRQWLIRDDVLNMDPGNVQLSPSMQSALMIHLFPIDEK